MKQKKNSEDLVYKFWRKYEEADYFQRRKLLKPIIKNFHNIGKIKDEKLYQHSFESFLQSYFDDLLDYCNCKDLIKKNG